MAAYSARYCARHGGREIPQSDATYFRPDNFASGAVVSAVRLELSVA
jgi:hypothetical protein